MKLLKSLLVGSFACLGITAAAQNVKITCDYPGGNVKVVKTAPGVAEVAPDLRDTPSYWFYWNFDAKSDAPGKVRFLFPEKRKTISAQGPCVSTDGGKTWRWLGKGGTRFIETEGNTEKRDSFEWTFTKAGETVRFAQGFPYQKADFDRFLAAIKDKVQVGSLTKTRKGADVPMLTIGKEAPGKKAVLLTARHHACEAIASFVWEGFVEEVLSDSPCGIEFRKKYVLYAVPFVDFDGVEAGDQGKNRAPHDHNRDYGLAKPLYPEVAALMKLCAEKKLFIALDLHAPSVRTDIHESFYLAGVKSPENQKISNVFLGWLHREIPAECFRTLHFGGKSFMKVSGDRGVAFSSYFPTQPSVAYGMTIEIPYANSNILYDSAVAKEYGRGVCRAIVRAEIKGPGEPGDALAKFEEIEKKLSAGSPQVLYAAAEQVLNDPASSSIYKVQAHLRKAWMLRRQKKDAEAIRACEAAMAEKDILLAQKFEAITLKTEALCRMNEAFPEEWLKKMNQLELGGDYGFRVWDAFYANAQKRDDVPGMLEFSMKQLPVTPGYHVGKIRNRIARCYIAQGKKELAAEYSKVTADYLRKRLFPNIPVGIFGPNQLLELAYALYMIPGTPRAEIDEVIKLGIEHKIGSKGQFRLQFEALKKKLDAEKR